MEDYFDEKFEELFGDLEEKLEDLFHSCMEKKFGEEKLDELEDYGRILGMRISEMVRDIKDNLGTEVWYLEDDLQEEFEDDDDDYDVPLEARGEPWNLDKDEDEDEQKELDDL